MYIHTPGAVTAKSQPGADPELCCRDRGLRVAVCVRRRDPRIVNILPAKLQRAEVKSRTGKNSVRNNSRTVTVVRTT
jgi:hypothetical protein